MSPVSHLAEADRLIINFMPLYLDQSIHQLQGFSVQKTANCIALDRQLLKKV